MRTTGVMIAGLCALGAGAAVAQLLPSVPIVDGVLRPVNGVLDRAMDTTARTARDLADARLSRIAALVRANPGRVALDPQGFPARAGEIVLGDPDAAVFAAALAKGFTLIEREEALGVGYARLAVPRGLGLKQAIRLLQALGAKDVSADQLYAGSGAADGASAPAAGNGVRVGMIDGGVAGATVTQRGFAAGAPRASRHGTAVASLIAGSGRVKGAAPGAQVLVADVYGSDPAGGNATAIVKAIGWLVGERVPVVTISLVGPPNPLLGRVVAAAQARGTIIVAAVGNDGAAAPPSYPASYPGVIAVTATDGRKRILIEAGRATHLDYAAPGADMLAGDMGGGAAPVRGTSFAAPLVAGLIARVYPAPDVRRRAAALAAVGAGAERLGSRYGRGLVCGACRTPPK
jgi:subtilisin family serine protease